MIEGIIMTGSLLNFILHIDKYIAVIIHGYGIWVYVVLFLIVFCETGFVVIPFLPGDSVLFTSGTFAALSLLNIKYLFLIFFAASVLGDTVNYHIGHLIGPKVFAKKDSKLFKREYLEKSHVFYEKHGGITIVMARFIPIIRTFAPFVAGIGKMSYLRFLSYNMTGGILWVALFILSGYYFGNFPLVKNNFSTVIYLIILVSLLPAIIGLLKNRRTGASR